VAAPGGSVAVSRERVAGVVERLKSVHYDLERMCAAAFSEGRNELAGQLSDAGTHVDSAIEALTAA
jgi:hypothetical protein